MFSDKDDSQTFPNLKHNNIMVYDSMAHSYFSGKKQNKQKNTTDLQRNLEPNFLLIIYEHGMFKLQWDESLTPIKS